VDADPPAGWGRPRGAGKEPTSAPEDILAFAYELAKSNQGTPGVDGQSFQEIESQGLEKWVIGIKDELHAKTYKPQSVRRVMIPKPGGGERPLGIPTIRDRVVQTAAKLVLEPIFEADLEPEAYGYRPKRSAHDAIKKDHKLLCEGYIDVVDADLSKYFDKIPHRELLQCVARRIVDRDVLRLVKMWLKAPVEERDEKGNRRMTGGRGSTCGTPLGGVASPMLANLYMNRFLKYWRITGRRERFQAYVVNYADDPEPRTCGRGTGLDAESHDTAGTHSERSENQHQASAQGTLRLSRLHVWAASLSEGWPLVSRSQSFEEECGQTPAKGERPLDSQQRGDLAGSARSAQQHLAGLVSLFQLRYPADGLSSGR
jgi:retron-type reverse transcriptase